MIAFLALAAKRLILKMHDKEGLNLFVFDNNDLLSLIEEQNLIILLQKNVEELRVS